MNPLRDQIHQYVAQLAATGAPIDDIKNRVVQRFVLNALLTAIMRPQPVRQPEASFVFATRTVMTMPVPARAPDAIESRVIIEEIVDEAPSAQILLAARSPSEPAVLPRSEAPHPQMAQFGTEMAAERPAGSSDGLDLRAGDASDTGNRNSASRLLQPQRQNLNQPSPTVQRPMTNPNNFQNGQELPRAVNINEHPDFIPSQNQKDNPVRQNPIIFQPALSKTVLESTSKQRGQVFSSTQQSAMIKLAQQSERTLKSPEFGTQAKLILASGHPLAPQTVSVLKDLSTLSFVLNYAKTATSETPSHPTLPQLQKELEDLEQQTLEILQPHKIPGEPSRGSFAMRQETLLNQLKSGLDSRVRELKNQMSALTEELDLPMKGQMSILLGQDAGLMKSQTTPFQEQMPNLPGRDPALMKGQTTSLTDDPEFTPPQKSTSSSIQRPSLPSEEMSTGTKSEMQEMRQAQTLTQTLEKPPLMMPPKEARLIFPESLKLAIRVKTEGDLNAAIKGVQDVSKTKSSNPIIMLPYPFQRRAEGPTNFKSKASQEGKSNGGMVDVDDEEQPMVFVAQGTVLVGDVFKEGLPEELPVRKLELENFLIGVVPVTNHQFAAWLNKKFQDQKIVIKDGMVFDLNRNLLAKTKSSSLTSQIEIVAKNGVLYFSADEGCEDNPVVQVSWNAANAFCEDNGVRLPTEAEWEKAAGMEQNDKKNRYGFSLNNIDFTRTNYQLEINGRLENRTTPVGFYNGENTFHHKGELVQTQNGAGPYGCYDMSGNVREWTSEAQENKKITKGGSYKTSAFELRVAAKLALNPDETFDDVGFRVALSV